MTPYCEVKPYLHWFVVRIFFPSSFELKTNQFSVEDLFCFVLDFTYFWAENPLLWRQWPFLFFFGLHLFLTEKGSHQEIRPRVPPSLATPLTKGIPQSPFIQTWRTLMGCAVGNDYGKKISLLWHWMSFLLCMKDSKTIFENFTKVPPQTHFSDPTCPKFWVFWFVVYHIDNLQA